MATLTGNKIKDTYQSLIKFSDNGTADGTLQLLSDGAVPLSLNFISD